MNTSLLTTALLFGLFFGVAQAATPQPSSTVAASCYVPLEEPQNIKGENIDVRLPIASVSKLITSYWAIKEKTIAYRFSTVFYLNQVGDGLYDLHIQGTRDPYFGAERFHYAISELNKRGITKIRNLTFDENFKFFWFIDDKDVNNSLAGGFYLARDPVPEKVISQLKAYANLSQGYDETVLRASESNIKMSEKVDFSVQSIEFLSLKDFVYNPLTMSKNSYIVSSTPMVNLLKEMNRNSNNHAANQIFEHLEAEQKFSQFLNKNLNLDMKSVVMLNGSGDRVDTAEGPRYNEASCSAMLKIMIDMYKTLKAQGSSFSRVATVIGSNQGTATRFYNSNKTFDAVAAKTGTVNPAVTLGGMANTERGIIFFMFNMKTNGTGKSWHEGRVLIKKNLKELMDKFDGGVRLKAKAFNFISFDDKSFAELQIPGETLK